MKKKTIFTLIFAIICTFLTSHWWITSVYWQHKIHGVTLFDNNISYGNFLVSIILYFVVFNVVLLKMKYIKTFIVVHKFDIVFLLSFFVVYLLLNHYAIYHTDYTLSWNQFYYADTNDRVREILLSRIKNYHPYWFLPFYPIFEFMFLLTKNVTLILMLIFSMLTSFTVLLVNKILNNINPKMKCLNYILTLIFGFSYTVIISYYTFEVYVVTAFYLTLLILLIIKELKSKEYNKTNMIFISIITALTFGVTISNIITVFILLLSIFYVKKQPKKILKYSFFVIILINFLLLFTFSINSTAFKKCNIFAYKVQISYWTNKEIKYGFVKQTLKMPMLAQNKEYSDVIMNGFWVCFVTLILLSLILLVKSPIKKEEKILFISLLFALFYNFVANYYWAQNEGFLFAPNHFALWFVIFAYSLKILDEELKKYKMTINNNFVVAILVLFLLVEIPTNYIANKNVQNKVMKKYPLTSPIIKVI